MELTKYKILKNLPQFKEGKHLNDYGSALFSTIASTVNTATSPTTEDQLYLSAPVTQRSIMGIPYIYRGDISSAVNNAGDQITSNMFNGIMQDTINGINVGSGYGKSSAKCGKLPKYFSGTGAAIGGMIGFGVGAFTKGIAADHAESVLKQLAANTRNRIQSGNILAKNAALNTGVYNQSYNDYLDTEYLTLRGAKDGKLPKHSLGVATWYGRSYTDPQTGWGTRGEKMGITDDNGNVIGYRTLGEDPNAKPNNYDKIRINLDPIHGFILDNNISRYVDKTGDILGGLALLNMKAAAKNMKMSEDGYLSSAKCGKLPKHSEGLPRHILPTWTQMLYGINLMSYAKNNPPELRNTYVKNAGLEQGLRDLASLHDSEYPILNDVYDLNAKNIKSIERSGGLGTGLKMLAKLTANRNALDMLAKFRQSNWYQNNKYKMALADARMKYGDLDAGRKSESFRYDYDQFARDHGAWVGIKDAAAQNIINALYSGATAASQMDMYKMAQSQYAQKLEDDKAEREAKWAAMAKQSDLLAKLIPLFLNGNGK